MWCLLGTAIMVVWLMAPVAKCSFAAFRDTPLSEAQRVREAYQWHRDGGGI